MIILGIDPGSRITGYGVIKIAGSNPQYLASGCIKITEQTWPAKLHTIYSDLIKIIELYQPQQVSIEKIFVHKNASSALKLGQARGVSILAAANSGLLVAEYAARAIKQAITGSGAATKPQVQFMIKNLLHLTATPSQDAADALAIAICHGLHIRSFMSQAVTNQQ